MQDLENVVKNNDGGALRILGNYYKTDRRVGFLASLVYAAYATTIPIMTASCGSSDPTPTGPSTVASMPNPEPPENPENPNPQPEPTPTPNPPMPQPPPPPASPITFIGAGDIAKCGSPEVELTAKILDMFPAAIVFTAGDNVYPAATDKNFRECYEPTWGRHKSRTRPSPGNHDYDPKEGADPSSYFRYFGENAGPSGLGYYSYEAGAWHIISLNSNIATNAISAQVQWLRLDLARTPQPPQGQPACTLAYFHHPLFSSSRNGSQTFMQNVWQALFEFGVDVVISGHDHVYERFMPQDPDGRYDPVRGIRQFVVGTGGADLYEFRRLLPNSEFSQAAHGILKLTLKAGGYDFEFVPADRRGSTDMGINEKCH